MSNAEAGPSKLPYMPAPELEPALTPALPSPPVPSAKPSFNAVAAKISHKLYAKGHVDCCVERMETSIPYPSQLTIQRWTTVVATLRGSVLKLVPEGKGHPEHFVVIGAVIDADFDPIRDTETGRMHEAIFRLTITTPFEVIALLFSCASQDKRRQWLTALQWANWERSRIDEIYTGHMIKNIVCQYSDDAESLGIAPSNLSEEGRFEGWVRVQVAGRADCGRLWMIAGPATKKHRTRTRSRSRSRVRFASSPRSPDPEKENEKQKQEREIAYPVLRLYTSNKSQGRKTPLLTVTDVKQAYAGYDRWRRRTEPLKTGWIMVYGVLGDHPEAGIYRDNEGWMAIEPCQDRDGSPHTPLDWLVALHDVFGLYGRPSGWSWDTNNPDSLFFGFPTGTDIDDKLFIDRKSTKSLRLSDSRPSSINLQFKEMLSSRQNLASLLSGSSSSDDEENPFLDPINVVDEPDADPELDPEPEQRNSDEIEEIRREPGETPPVSQPLQRSTSRVSTVTTATAPPPYSSVGTEEREMFQAILASQSFTSSDILTPRSSLRRPDRPLPPIPNTA